MTLFGKPEQETNKKAVVTKFILVGLAKKQELNSC